MFENTPRCKSKLLIMLASVATLIGGTAFAQEHGAGITKSCGDVVRACESNDDCADDNECTVNECDTTTNPNTLYNCTFTVFNADGFEDTIRLTNIGDLITTAGGDVLITFPDLTVDSISGNATCTDVGGGVMGLPCLIGPATDVLTVGSVRFRSNTYNPTMDDPDPLPDQAGGVYFDVCDGIPSQSCNTDQPNTLQASSQQQTESGCTESELPCDDGTVCTTDSCDPATGCVFDEISCDDNNVCTTDSCDPVTGCSNVEDVNCDDGNACTTDSCDPITGCSNVEDVVCDDGNACTTDSCDPAVGCVFTEDVVCDDGNACTTESCDPVSGCVSGDPVDCDDGDACTTESCDPATGCVSGDPVNCDDGDACTTESCDPASGCVSGDPVDCDDDNACTTDSCDPALGCVNNEDVVCDDGNACTTDSCDPAVGCVYTEDVVCDDGDACTTESCDPVSGCVSGDPVDCDDGDACTTESCDPATGCVSGDPVDCDDGDECTIDSCDPITGCVHEADPACDVAICRTPGFWATHGGLEKNRSVNITQEVIDSVGGLNVCGVTIDNTAIGNETSALEAMCVSVKGVTERQLVRQLTAAALNCVMSGGDSSCVGGPIEELFADCNAACVGDPSDLSANECIGAIDCFNNGGAWDGDSCTNNPGVCLDEGGGGSGAACDASDPESCEAPGESCQPDPGFESCHEAELCQLDEEGEPVEGLCFEPPGPAGSSGACNTARKNDVYVGDYD